MWWSFSAPVAADPIRRSLETGVSGRGSRKTSGLPWKRPRAGRRSRRQHGDVWMFLVGLWLGTAAANAQNATWLPFPNLGSSDWNTAGNWVPMTVPTATATFEASNTTSITFANNASVGALQFNAGAPAYSFNLAGTTLTLTGTGVVNDSSHNPMFSLAAMASLVLQGASTVGNAIVTVNNGGTVTLENSSSGGQARFVTNSGGTFDISGLTSGGTTAGSIEGAGAYQLGSKVLTVGLNNLSTEVPGTLVDGGQNGGVGGALIKVGTGTLTLSGLNTYSGGTSFNGGIVAVKSEANIGTGRFSFDGGTLRALAAGSGLHSNNPVTLNSGGGTLSADSTTSSALGGAISGPGSLTIEGGGTLTLAGANTYSGGTRISGASVAGNLVGGVVVDSDSNLGSGPLTFDGGTLEVLATNGGMTSSKAITLLASGGTFQTDAGTTTTLSGAISGEGSLISSVGSLRKSGPGTLILTGVNTYGGITAVQEGVLRAGSSTAFSPKAGMAVLSVLDLNGFDNTVVFLSGNGIVTNNGTVPANLTVGSNIPGAPSTTFFGTLTDGSSPLTLIVSAGGQIDLAGVNTYSGGTHIVHGLLAVQSDQNLGIGPLLFDAGTLVLGSPFQVTSFARPVTLNSAGGTLQVPLLSTATFSGLISGAGVLTDFGIGTLILTGVNTYRGGTDIVLGTVAVNGDSNLGSGPLSFDGGTLEALAAGEGISSSKAIALRSGGGTFLADVGTSSTLSGPFTGIGSFTKDGPGKLILAGVNTYSGPTEVLLGTMGTGSSSGFSPNSAFNVASVLDLNGFNNTIGSLSGTGIVTNDGARSANLTVGLDNTDTIFSGTLTDGRAVLVLTKAGQGTFALGGINTYSGATKVAAGTLEAGSFTALSAHSAFTVTSGLELNGFNNTIGSLAGTGTVSNHGATLANLTVGADNTDTIFSGVLTDGGSGGLELTKQGTGTLTLTGLSSYSGGTRFNQGTLAVNADHNLGIGPLSFDGGTLEALATGGGILSSKTITLSSGGATFLSDVGTTSTLSGPVTGVGSFTKDGPGTLILSGVNTYSGVTEVALGTLGAGSSSGFSRNSVFHVTSVLDLTGFNNTIGSLSGTGIVTNDGVRSANLIVGVDNTRTIFSGTLTDGRGVLELTKAGQGTFTLGGVNTYSGATNVAAGILEAGSFTALSAHSAFTVTSGLELNGFNNTIGSLSGTGTVSNHGAALANLTVGANNTDTIFSGVLTDSGSSGLGLTKKGTGTLTLTGLSSYSGGTHFNQGTLAVNADHNLGIGPLSFDGGTLETLAAGGGITSKKAITLLSGGGTFLADAGTTSTLGGAISGTGSLTKDGLGTLVLTGTNSYSGGTVLSAGTLTVHGPQVLGFGNVVVSGGTLSADPQLINVTGNYTQTTGGTLQLQVAGANPGQYDSLNAGGNATLGGSLQLISLGFQPQAGNLLTLVTTGGVVSGRFARFVDPFVNWAGPHSIVELLYQHHSVQLLFLNLDSAASVAGLTAFYEISFSNANIQRLNLESRLDDLRGGSNGFSSNMKVNGATVDTDDKSGVDGKSSQAVVEPILQPGPGNRWGVWMTGFGDFVSVDDDANASGYYFTTGGVSLGIDYRISDQLAIGVMGEYSHTWTSLQPSGNIDVNSGRAGLYATWYNRGFYLNGAIYGGRNNYASSRSSLGGLAAANTAGAEWSTFVSGGYDFHFGPLTVGPIAALQYTYANIDGFSENGSLAPLQVESNSVDSLRSDVGFRLFYQWQIAKVLIEPSIKVAWEHEYLYSALPITAGFVGIPGSSATFFGPNEGHDSAIVSAGVSAQWTPALTIYVNYDGQLGRENYNSNGVTGGVRISF